ncbi:putative Zn(2)-C6 fungal-type domain-containing protein [Seiridium unicorne]|uniref:Zn(2)-C6 fungal-type domain-containing protein n=1 Tax=Seiridium unicorne TaxID=138068 RepID=A0ABR2V9N1_9PEZI
MSSYRIGDRELLCDPPPPDKAPAGKKRKSTSRTCERCRRRKQQCSDSRPCARCVKANVECVEGAEHRNRGRPLGQSGGELRDRCITCLAANSTCFLSEGAPCERCRRLTLWCSRCGTQTLEAAEEPTSTNSNQYGGSFQEAPDSYEGNV